MNRLLTALLVLAALATTARAHFAFVVPEPGGGVAYVILSEDLDPDEEVGAGMLAGLQLHVRSAAGEDQLLDLVLDGAAFRVSYDGDDARLLHGGLQLGLHQAGDRPANLISYHPKAILGDAFGDGARIAEDHVVELVPVGRVGDLRFQLLSHGAPVAGAEVTVLLPDGGAREVTTDDQGLTSSFTQTGRFGAWSKAQVGGPGQHEGEDYAASFAYATLVAQIGQERRAPAAPAPLAVSDDFPRLPQATSSFGAVEAGGWLYVYGGHIARTHTYDTGAVSGQFARLRLDGSTVWESLPPGQRLQGLNLAAHGDRVYRAGGMQPRNPRGSHEDNYSVADCARFNPDSGQWEWLAPLPEGRSSHDLIVMDDTLYVVGGWTMLGSVEGQVWPDDMLTLDLGDPLAQWRRIPQPFARRALIVAELDGRLWVMGGMDDADEISREVDVYDPASGRWARGPELPGGHPIAGFASAACVLDDRLYISVAGGELLRLTEDQRSWESIGRHTPRIVHRLIPWRGRILAAGGAADGTNLDLVEVIDPGALAAPTAGLAPTAERRPVARPVADTPAVEASSGTVAAAPEAATGGAQVFCPVMTNVEVLGDDEAIPVSFGGQEVLLCCSKCVRKWEADPEAYLSAEVLPQLADQDLPERTLAQVYCPVYPTRVVSENDPFVMYEGQKVYLFNKTAVRRFTEDPERYLDPAILPQLAAGSGDAGR